MIIHTEVLLCPTFQYIVTFTLYIMYQILHLILLLCSFNTKIKIAPSVDEGRILIRLLVTV